MSNPYDLLEAPGEAFGGTVGAPWFGAIAELLLNNTRLMVAGKPHRLIEIEYYYNGGAHPDPFAHGDPVQQTSGKWYFHRDNGSYRGGSFKGLDITFGGEGVFGGILIRTMASLGEDATFVNGSSLCADHLLRTSGKAKVAELDAEVFPKAVWDTDSLLHLAHAPDLESKTIYDTARVGLTLKRAYQHAEMPRYIMKPYRFLTEPRLVKKGKIHTSIALYQSGKSVEEIYGLTRSPKKSIQKYIDAHKEGEALTSMRRFYGKSLKNDDLCQMHGCWQAKYAD